MFELNKDMVPPGMKFVVNGSQLRLAPSVDTTRKTISVFNDVERLNKHPSLCIIYLKQLAHSKGIAFSIDQTAHQPDETAKPVSTAKDARTNYIIQAIRDAPNITASEYDELTRRKKQGQTTTEKKL